MKQKINTDHQTMVQSNQLRKRDLIYIRYHIALVTFMAFSLLKLDGIEGFHVPRRYPTSFAQIIKLRQNVGHISGQKRAIRDHTLNTLISSNGNGLSKDNNRVMSHLNSLISPEDTWSNIAALSSLATLVQNPSIADNFAPIRWLGPPVSAMAMAFFLASVGVLPAGGSVGAKQLQGISLKLATPLLLLGAEIRFATLRKRCGALLNSFILASFATTVACIFAIYATGASLFTTLGGNDGYKIAAALLGKNIGGGINYMAIASSLQASPQAVAAGLCVDNIFALVYFPVTSALAAERADVIDDPNVVEKLDTSKTENEHDNDITIQSVSTVLSLAAIFIAAGDRLGGVSASIPICTLLTVLFTMTFPENVLKSIRPAGTVLGTSLLYMFFATAGAPGLSLASSTIRKSFLPLSLYLSILYSVHGLILWLGIITWKKFNQRHGISPKKEGMMAPQRLLVASSAAIGGPATAAALAQANGWKSLVVPSLLVGNLGYAIATFLGLAFYTFCLGAFR